MSVSKWAYTPEVCDGAPCVGDCDLCENCKHNDNPWYEEPCDSCCGSHSGYEETSMSDYISRQAAIKVVKIETNDAERLYNNIVEGLRYIPSADVVEVVRCKDCRHADFAGMKNGSCYCLNFGIRTSENHYCSLGEREDD